MPGRCSGYTDHLMSGQGSALLNSNSATLITEHIPGIQHDGRRRQHLNGVPKELYDSGVDSQYAAGDIHGSDFAATMNMYVKSWTSQTKELAV